MSGGFVLTQVSKRYRAGGPWVLDGIDLELTPGDLVRVLGGNGTGKSTLLRLVAGVGRPTRGRIGNRPVTGYVPERFPPALPLTALDYLAHLGRIHGLTTAQARTRGAELLELFGASGFAGTTLRELSKGTAQKVAVAQALLPGPGLLVLDEAWAGLDDLAEAVLEAQVDRLLEAGTAVIFVDHDPARLVGRPTRAFRLDDGHLVPVAVPALPPDPFGPDPRRTRAFPLPYRGGAAPAAVQASGPIPLGVHHTASIPVAAPPGLVDLELDGLPALPPDDVNALLGAPFEVTTLPVSGSPDLVRLRVRVPAAWVDDVLRRVLGIAPGAHVHRLVPLDTSAPADRPATDRPVTERPASERPVNDRPGADRPVPHGSVADRSAADRSAAEHQEADRPAAERSGVGRVEAAGTVTDRSAGDGPGGERSRERAVLAEVAVREELA